MWSRHEVMSAKILLVDDSGLARRSTRRILEGAGYTVVEAEDGHSALEQFAVERPDLVLLDLLMKGMRTRRPQETPTDGSDRPRHHRIGRHARLLAGNGPVAGAAESSLPAEPAEVIDMAGQVISRSAPWS